MMDQIAYGIISLMAGLLIAGVLYVAAWVPKKRMKGHAGRGKCKCCTGNK